MSAISGIFRMDGQDVDPKLIKDMNNILSHRGPDGSGVWLDGPVAFGHQMLHTTPESLLEKLPFKDETTGLVITADARIDNRDELSPLLHLKNTKKVPDSLFILKAYQKWSENCPQKLLGDFAFAIWDPDKGQLFCANDHMGIKSFYYYLSKNIFCFSTEIKSLLTLKDTSYKLNDVKVAYHLIKMHLDKELTFYENIFRLPSAHSIKIDDDLKEINEYWVLDPELKIEMNSDDEYINTFREIFKEAVNCRLRSSFPIGFELSGGLDSSSITCMAKKILNQSNSHFKDIETFSYVLNELPQIDESNYIKNIVNKGGIKDHFICGDTIGPLDDMKNILWYQEQPFFTPNMAIFWNLYKKMQKKNIRIVLNGEGGDAVSFTGQNYLKELLATFKWKKLIKEIDCYSNRVDRSFTDVFINLAFFPILPNLAKKLLLRTHLKEDPRYNILDKELAKKCGGIEYLKKISQDPFQAAKTSRQHHHLILTQLSIDSIRMRDQIGSAFSIEPRFPFFDKRLVEFCYAVPNDIKFRLGWDRYLHRVAMDDIVPKENQWRQFKFVANPLFERNLFLFEKDYLEKMIYSKNSKINNYVDSIVLKDMYNSYQSGKTNNLVYLWFVMILNFWLENYD